MFILGEKDPVLPVKNGIMEAKETESEAVVLFGGHMGHIENTDALIAALKKFINQC
jgi:pimeloyl-ACP methyl ester carboxylesterase